MAGRLTFKVSVYQTNTDVLPELQRKVKDLSPLFEDIVDTWAELNKQKFKMGEGHESTGAQIDPTVFWQGLSPKYLEQKNRTHPTNALMVRTGSLRASLTDPHGFFRMINAEQAIFGTPNDADDAMKVQYNWMTRQAVFLADWDQNMIREKVSKFFVVQMRNVTQEVAQMDADFAGTVG